MKYNNKLSPSFNVINGKTSPYGIKENKRRYHYWSNPKLGPGIVAIRRITWSCHACTTLLFLWIQKAKKQLFILYMVEYIITNTLKPLVVTITGFYWILKMMEQMKKFTNTLFETFLIVMWWTCLRSLCKENMMILMLMILHVVVNILSVFFIFIYPSSRLEYWWASYFFLWNGMWRNLFLSNQYLYSIFCFTKN